VSIHRIRLPLGALAVAAALTACGGGEGNSAPSGAAGSSPSSSTPSSSTPSSSTPSSSPGEADVTFAQQMTAHHQQAVEMAQLAADRAGSDEVRALAARTAAAQGPEIETMTGWLDAWGADAPMSGMTDIPGAMSEAEMGRLAGLSGTAFDREFLTMMISHHQGALAMAETEQTDGSDPAAVALAGSIVADQTAQLAEMQSLLGRL